MNKDIKNRFHKLRLFLELNGFKLSEVTRTRLKFIKNGIFFFISFNELEKKNEIFFNWNNNFSITISNSLLKEYYKVDLEIDYSNEKDFSKKIITFFENEGRELIMGENNAYKKIYEYQRVINRNYSKKYTLPRA